MKKGFTLIELLAVIIILAIIALIATPIILNVIEESRNSANLSQANILLSGAENYYAASFLDSEKSKNINGITNIYPFIETTNEKPPLGNVKINKEGEIFFALFLDDVCYSKDYKQSKLVVLKDIKTEEECVPLSIVATTDKETINDYYPGDTKITLLTNGTGIEYCVGACGTYTKVDEKSTEIILTETKKVCFVAVKDTIVEDTRQCLDFSIDSVTPTIEAKSNTISAIINTSNILTDYLNTTFGPTGGTTSCDVQNTIDLELGNHTINCTATGLNGKTATTSLNISVNDGNKMVSGADFQTKISLHSETITDIIFSSTKTGNYDTALTKYDFSLNGGEVVVGYLEEVDNKKILYIEANGPILAHPNIGGSCSGGPKNSMFCEMFKLKNIEFNDSFDTSNSVTFHSLFHSTTSLESLDLSSFNTSNVTNMYATFFMTTTSQLKSINLTGWDTSKVTTMYGMFMRNGNLENLNVSHFNTTLVTNMDYMFYGINNASYDLSNFNTSNVTTMNSMFGYNRSLQTLDLSSFQLDKIGFYGLDGIFSSSEALTTVYAKSQTEVNLLNSSRYKPSNVTVLVKP